MFCTQRQHGSTFLSVGRSLAGTDPMTLSSVSAVVFTGVTHTLKLVGVDSWSSRVPSSSRRGITQCLSERDKCTDRVRLASKPSRTSSAHPGRGSLRWMAVGEVALKTSRDRGIGMLVHVSPLLSLVSCASAHQIRSTRTVTSIWKGVLAPTIQWVTSYSGSGGTCAMEPSGKGTGLAEPEDRGLTQQPTLCRKTIRACAWPPVPGKAEPA